jgi:L-ascorbate metabolism protein UlaG (beta-lactamase superfamily)
LTTPARVTWLGHSTVMIELQSTTILTDPLLRGRVMHLRRIAPATPREIDVDAVLISHAHWDHLDLGSLELLRRDVLIVVPRGAGQLVAKRRFSNVVELADGGRVELDGAEVRATEARHPVSNWVRRSAALALGFVVEGSQCVYFAGDTDLFDGMNTLAPRLDVALLPVAGWGPRLPPGHLDPERAAQALGMLRPAVAVPIHWGTYAPLGTRRTASPTAAPDEFRRRAATLAPEVDVRILSVGESTEVR